MEKILVISREFPPSLGGAGIAMHNYIKNIKSYKFFVLSYFEPIFSNENIVVKKLKNPFGFTRRYSSALYFIFSSIFNSLRGYDCIIGNAFIGSACGAIAKMMTNKPLISIIHDIDYLYGLQCDYNPLNKFVRKLMHKLIVAKSDVIIVPNVLIKKEITRVFGDAANKKTVVITLGVDLEPFEKIRKPRGKRIILFVGAVRKNKGVEYLIGAFKDVLDKFGNTELWIAGSILDHDYYNKLTELATQLKIKNKVKFLGPVKHFGKKNVFSYYDVCDIFVIASYHSERFGIPCVEASLMGKPIVATDVFEENGVIVNKKTALVVPRKNTKALADAMIKFLGNKKLGEKLGEQAKEYAKRFGTAKLSKEFEDVIKDLIG